MNTLLSLLALVGGAAAAWHLVRAALRFLRGGASKIWTEEMGRTHARRGDLTSMDDTMREREMARRDARISGLLAVGWFLLLVAPTFTSYPRELYAAYTVFWIGPFARRSGKRRSGARGPGEQQ